MVEWTWQKIGAAVLAVLGGIFIIAWGLGGFGPIKETVENIIGFVNPFIGAEEVPRRLEAPIQPEQEQVLDQFQQTAQSLRQANVDPGFGGCFANYRQFPPLGGDSFSGFPDFGGDTPQQLSVEFVFDDGGTADDRNDDQTEVIVSGGPAGGQYLESESFTIDRMRPCVIAGEARSPDGVLPAEKFRQRFLYEQYQAPLGTPILEPYPHHFTPVDSITLIWLNEDNAIRWSPAGNVAIDEQNNLEDGGWLYTPDSYHLCFFPTLDNLWDAPANEEGIRGYFLSRSSWPNSLSWQGRRYQLNFCELLLYEMPTGEFGAEIIAQWDGYSYHYQYNREADRWESCPGREDCSDIERNDWSAVQRLVINGRERALPTRLVSLDETAGYDLFYDIRTRVIPSALNPSSPSHDEWQEEYDMIQSLENLPQRIEEAS